MPSYHPLSPSQLLLAAAARAAAFAHRRTVDGDSVADTSTRSDAADDVGDQQAGGLGIDDDAEARRSSSRTRRPAAKVRDGASATPAAEVEGDNTSVATQDNVDGSNTGNNKSPKRKRAGGGGAGSRKRKKEATSNTGSTEPAQPRRTRERRGAAAAAAAALAEGAEAENPENDEEAMDVDSTEANAQNGSAVVSPPVSSGATGSPEDEKDAESVAKDEKPEGPAVRRKRPRKAVARNAPPNLANAPSTRSTSTRLRRRGSSASGSEATGTSVSVPIASSSKELADIADDMKEDEDDEMANVDPALRPGAEGASVGAPNTTSSSTEDTSTAAGIEEKIGAEGA